MSTYDSPNQEVVRPDGSPPWEEGEGGSEHAEAAPQEAEEKPAKRGPGRPRKADKEPDEEEAG